MFRRSATAVVALTAAVGLIAGCGGSSSGGKAPVSNVSGATAADELSNALSGLGQASTLTATLKLDASGSQLLDYVRSQNKGTHLSAQQAALLASGSVTFEVAAPSGKTISTMGSLSDDGAANIDVAAKTGDVITLRVVNKTLYLRASLKDVLNAAGKAETYRQLVGGSAQLPPFLSALVQGKWVSLPLATLKGLAGSLGAGTTPSGSAKSNHFLDQLKSLLTKDVTVTKSTSGDTDTLTLTTNLRSFAGDLETTFTSALPAAGTALNGNDLSKVPDKKVSLVATVTGGALASLKFDLGQVAKSGSASLPLELDFARSGPSIGVPSGAVAVDLSQLAGLFGAFGGGGL
ncbi:MAG TPA: hypothetical protein VHE56_13180 [Mycobacteriales bacterium]|nr:hypothetical protein [Mycobacteriales bacterium]